MSIAGVWQNEYGSRMAVVADGAVVRGIYDSTTGATGRYLVQGRQAARGANAGEGQPVSLAISWHSISGDPVDAGWHWTSILAGQISVIDGEETLLVSHLLGATSGLNGLCERGVYLDKLTYRRIGPPMDVEDDDYQKARRTGNWLSGSWEDGQNISLRISVEADSLHRIGFISGDLKLGDQICELSGFTDINADKSKVDFQSVAMTALRPDGNAAFGLGGWLETATGVLTLQLLSTEPTIADAIWVQTKIAPLRLRRVAG